MTCRSMLVLVLALASACGPMRKDTYYSINADGSRSQRYSRINQYAGYGKDALGAQAKVAAAYEAAQHAPPPAIDIEVFNAALPPGVTLEDGAVEIAADAPYESVGRFEIGYWLDSAPQEAEVEDDLRRLAAVTSANVVVVEVTRVDHADTRVNFLSGILLRRRAVAPEAAPVATAEAPVAARPHASARLIYAATPRGCLTATELADEVSAKLGYSPWTELAERAVRVEIEREGDRYRATVAFGDGATKQLAGATCRTVTDAAISVVVVQLDEPSARRID